MVTKGTIKSYKYNTVDQDGNVVSTPTDDDNRNTERLTLVFNDDTTLIIDTFCSGCAQDTCMFFSGIV